MALLSRKRVILAKTETTYGTDPTPTGGANAVLVRNLSITPQNSEMVSRDLVRPYLGASEQIEAGVHVTCEFEVEVAGSGTAGTAPAYGPLLLACGMAATTSAGVSVTYAPVSSTFSSVTIYYNVDGVLHKITGARGNVQISLQVGQIPVYRFSFTGLYVAPTDTALPSPTYTAYQTPLACNSDNSTGFQLHSYAGALQSAEVNFGNAINYRMLVGSEAVLLTDRQVSGTVIMEATTIAAKDYFAAALATTIGNFQITHGTTAGNRVQVTSSRVALGAPTYQDSDGTQMLSLPMTFVPTTAGNDEISIVVT